MRSRYRLLPLLLAASCAGAPGLIARADAQIGAIAAPGNGVGSAFELAFWQSIGSSSDPAMFAAYLEQYPTGTFASLARAKIAASRRADPVAPPTQPVVAVMAAPAAVAPPPAPAPAPVAASVASVRVIPAMVAPFAVQPAAAPVLGNTALLAALAQSQVTGGASASAQAAPLPDRPALAQVPAVQVPDHFCSAEARNQFHDTVYKPAMAVATANNASAIRYLQTLDAQYRALGAQNDAAGMNALAAGSKAYQPIAAEAFATSNAYAQLFGRIMATPVRECRS